MSKSCIKRILMPLCPSSELIPSLRETLQKIDENFASSQEEFNIAELKHILLQRIADIEEADKSEAALKQMGTATEATTSPVGLSLEA